MEEQVARTEQPPAFVLKHGEGMTRDQAVRFCHAIGYRYVKTYGGWLPVEDWTPYGVGEPRFTYEHGTLVDLPHPKDDRADVVLGVWHLARSGVEVVV